SPEATACSRSLAPAVKWSSSWTSSGKVGEAGQLVQSEVTVVAMRATRPRARRAAGAGARAAPPGARRGGRPPPAGRPPRRPARRGRGGAHAAARFLGDGYEGQEPARRRAAGGAGGLDLDELAGAREAEQVAHAGVEERLERVVALGLGVEGELERVAGHGPL